MEQDYNFWRDLLDTYQSLPDWLKLLWLLIPAAMITAAGNALTRLVKHTVSGSGGGGDKFPSPPQSAYRGTFDANGILYLEPVDPAAATSLADGGGGEQGTSALPRPPVRQPGLD